MLAAESDRQNHVPSSIRATLVDDQGLKNDVTTIYRHAKLQDKNKAAWISNRFVLELLAMIRMAYLLVKPTILHNHLQ